MKRIKKVSQTVPTSAQVVDGHSDSTTDSYSCNYVNGIMDYSTSEQVVGRWTNNKPLYRKVVDFNLPTVTQDGTYPNPSATTVGSNMDLAFIETIFSTVISSTQKDFWYLPYVNDERQNRFYIRIDNNNSATLYAYTNNIYWSGVSCKAIVLYTKTTD